MNHSSFPPATDAPAPGSAPLRLLPEIPTAPLRSVTFDAVITGVIADSTDAAWHTKSGTTGYHTAFAPPQIRPVSFGIDRVWVRWEAGNEQ